MANHLFQQFAFGLEKYPVRLYGRVSFGAAGAPTKAAYPDNRGITSVTRVSAGRYNVLLDQPYIKLLYAGAVFVDAGAPASGEFRVVSDTSNVASAPTVQIQFATGGVATDPGSGEVVLLELVLRNSSAP